MGAAYCGAYAGKTAFAFRWFMSPELALHEHHAAIPHINTSAMTIPAIPPLFTASFFEGVKYLQELRALPELEQEGVKHLALSVKEDWRVGMKMREL